MTITDIAHAVEADTLRRRITEAEHRLAHEQQEWDSLASPIRERRDTSLDKYATSGIHGYLVAANEARDELRALPERPIESISTGLLRGRLHKLESEEARAA